MNSTKRRFQIACLQTSPQPDFQTALDQAISLAEEAATSGAEFIATPSTVADSKPKAQALHRQAHPKHPTLS